MRTLDRYVLRLLVPNVVWAFAGMGLLLVVFDAMSHLHQYAQRAETTPGFWGVLARYYGARAAIEMLRFGAAATLIAASMTVFQMARDGELTAAAAAGTGLARALAPIAAFALAATVACSALTLMWADDLARAKVAASAILVRNMPLPEGVDVYSREPDGRELVLHADHMDADGWSASGVTLTCYPPADAGEPFVLRAATAVYREERGAWAVAAADGGPAPRWSLRPARSADGPQDGPAEALALLTAEPQNREQALLLWEQVRDLPAAGPRALLPVTEVKTRLTPARLRCHVLDLSLVATSDLVEAQDMPEVAAELYGRLTIPWAHLAVVLWGVMIMARLGAARPVIGAAAALGVAVLFHGIEFAGAAVALAAALPAAATIALPALLFLAGGIAAWLRMDRAR